MGAIPSELGPLIDDINDIFGRLRTLEAPSGEALASTVAKLESLVADLDARLDAYIMTDLPALVASQIASYLSSNVSIGGSLLVNGDIIAPAVRALDLSAAPGRVSTWQAGDGRLGHT